MRRRATVRVQRPAQEVFAYLGDVTNETEWRKSVVESLYKDEGPLTIGTEGQTGVAMSDKRIVMGWTVVEYVPGRHVRWQLTDGPWRGGGSYTVEAADDGAATVTAALEVRLAGMARLLEPAMGVVLGRGLRQDLKRLDTLLTTTSPGSSAN